MAHTNSGNRSVKLFWFLSLSPFCFLPTKKKPNTHFLNFNA